MKAPLVLGLLALMGGVVAGCSSSSGASSDSSEAEGAGGADASATPGQQLACVEPGRWVLTNAVAMDAQNDGREWQRSVDVRHQYAEADAETYCAALSLNGQSGWRLPTANDLQSLLLRPSGLEDRPGDCTPSLDQVAFPSTPSDDFWSSSKPLPQDPDSGMYTGFDDGRTHPADLSTPMFVRCVHDPATLGSE